MLRDAYEDNLTKQQGKPKDSNVATLFPEFTKVAKGKVEEYKGYKDPHGLGYQRLCSVPSFALRLVMASRIRRHYIHAPWFKIKNLTRVLEAHGAVRMQQNMIAVKE